MKQAILFLNLIMTGILLTSCSEITKEEDNHIYLVTFNNNVSMVANVEEINDFKINGYEINGWYIDSSLSIAFYDCDYKGDLVLYASLTPYTINFYVDKSLYDIKTFENGLLELPISPGNNQSAFDGWYLEESYNTKLDLNNVTKNMNVYAKLLSIIEM